MKEDENNMEKDLGLEGLLESALKEEPPYRLPYGFAAMVTRKVFSRKVQRTGDFSLALLLGAGIAALLITLAVVIYPEMKQVVFAVLKPAKYIIGFIVLSLVLIDFSDRKWIRS